MAFIEVSLFGRAGADAYNQFTEKLTNIIGNELKITPLSKFPFEIKLVNLALLNETEKYYYMKCMKGQAESCIH